MTWPTFKACLAVSMSRTLPVSKFSRTVRSELRPLRYSLRVLRLARALMPILSSVSASRRSYVGFFILS